MNDQYDVLVVGAGAAGLMCAISAARTNSNRRIVAIDSASTLGAKILVAGGGRCNVTHDVVDHTAYFGSSQHAIKKVLRQYPVAETISFFKSIGVDLKREDTGKLFPTTDSARTVLTSLLAEARRLGVEIAYPRRVTHISRVPVPPDTTGTDAAPPRFMVAGDWGFYLCSKIVLATGGMSLPKSGSDGTGYSLAHSLGHPMPRQLHPALVPLLLPKDHLICSLSGIALPVTLHVNSPSGRRIASFTDSSLCTHFGLSGPCTLDISRHYLHAVASDPDSYLSANWVPEHTFDSFDTALIAESSSSIGALLRDLLPARFADGVCGQLSIDPAHRVHSLSRDLRRSLVRELTSMRLPVIGNRGYNYAEVTAGGIPLDEIHLDTMESRICTGLHFCGEICDVDGRIGGYNFQWAWSSGYVAGVSV